MIPALCLSDPAMPFAAALRMASDGGFSRVVAGAWEQRPPADYEALADTGLIVAGTVLGNLPPGCTLDDADVTRRRTAVETVKRQLADSAHLGAQFAILHPGENPAPASRPWFLEACDLLAEFAGSRMMLLGLPHRRASALPSPAHALSFLDQLPPAAGLVLDLDECRAVAESPAAWVARAGSRLTCVRLAMEERGSPSPEDELAALRQAGFGGLVVLATHERSRAVIAQMRALFP
jgi:sugar phosphate isomerase/epimerase